MCVCLHRVDCLIIFSVVYNVSRGRVCVCLHRCVVYDVFRGRVCVYLHICECQRGEVGWAPASVLNFGMLKLRWGFGKASN